MLRIRLPLRTAGMAAIAGWGMRQTAKKARSWAMRHGLPYIALEDGFLRSCDLGARGASPFSLVVDDIGIYYDSAKPSRLELLIASLVLDDGLKADALRAMDLIRRHRLSKYNHAADLALPSLSPGRTSRVLVVDQTLGDLSISLGGAGPETFERMLAAAIAENPSAEIWIKTHPDVLAGGKSGVLSALPRLPQVRLLAEDSSSLSLLEQVDRVYVVTSHMGFEALMLNKPVVCFGQPWYAGWGLTDDRHYEMPKLLARRGIKRTVEELFAAAYLQYARYIKPATGESGTIFDVIDWLARNKRTNDSMRGTLFCVGMSSWKKAIVRPFLAGSSGRLHFVSSARALQRLTTPKDAAIVVWGCHEEEGVRAVASGKRLPVWRVEDGFLRSVGLGSDLFRPISLTFDRSGIHYDPLSGSDLEKLISTQSLDAEELARAARFRQMFVARRLSKYNLGHSRLAVDAKGRKIILVPGQVEDDASIRKGAPLVRTNLDLLGTVRAANPEAYIMYKPHPDVACGNRRGAIEPEALHYLADLCVPDANVIDCILAADEIHTMTSQTGFEALLHGRVVHCYGAPFYAGWGLTVDHLPLPHRSRRVTLEELIHAALLEYPRYVLPGVRGLVSAETAMTWLKEKAGRSSEMKETAVLTGWLRRNMRKLTALAEMLGDGYREIMS